MLNRTTRTTSSRLASTIRCSQEWKDVQFDLVPWVPGRRDARQFTRLRCRAYARHGVLRAAATADTCASSCSHIVVARDHRGALLGGIRIHRRDRGLLPVEAALPDSSELRQLFTELDDIAELSGAVVAAQACKTGLGAALLCAAIAAIPLLGQRAAVGFGHQHVLALYARFGLQPDPRFPVYPYPDARYQSRVLVLRDARILPGVAADERDRIRAVRQQLYARAHIVQGMAQRPCRSAGASRP